MNGSQAPEMNSNTPSSILVYKPDKPERHDDNALTQSSLDESFSVNNHSRARVHSILKTRISAIPDPATPKRRDTYGSQIVTGSKQHHIQFKPELCEVKEVESYKAYNLDSTEMILKLKQSISDLFGLNTPVSSKMSAQILIKKKDKEKRKMFDPSLIPPPTEKVDKLLQKILIDSRASKDHLEVVNRTLEYSQWKITDAIKKAPTVSEYFNTLWEAQDIKDKAREIVAGAIKEREKKYENEINNGEIIVSENPVDIEDVILPESKIGKYTRYRFEEKAKDLARVTESLDAKRHLTLETQNNDCSDIMKYVTKATATTTNQGSKQIRQLHYSSAGTLMIGASAEIDLIKQQQAGEFVKRLHEEKSQFEKKIKEIEADLERREQTQTNQLRELEEKKELERLKKKKEKLEKSLKEIRDRAEARLKSKEEWEQLYKAQKEKKPLHVLLEERYQNEHVLPALEMRKQRLKHIREFHKPLAKEELLEHEKKVQKQFEEAHAKRSQQYQRSTKNLPVVLSPLMAEILEQEKMKSAELAQEKKRQREEFEKFKNKINRQKVSVDPAKEEELKKLIQKEEQARNKRSTKGEDPPKELDENELKMQRTKKLQNLIIAKNMRKYETLEQERQAKKELNKSASGSMYPNYWNDVKKKLNIHSNMDDWKNIASSKDLSLKAKTDQIMIEAEKLEEKAKMKERMMRVKKGNKGDVGQFANEADEIDKMYINSIKAKLSLLNDDGYLDRREGKSHNDSLMSKARSPTEKKLRNIRGQDRENSLPDVGSNPKSTKHRDSAEALHGKHLPDMNARSKKNFVPKQDEEELRGRNNHVNDHAQDEDEVY